ncbi:hypothetical protein Hypma_012624 [Hypsizygus marmoreus]|uniref:Ankyrin repeat protein n=1 Tax=Hypsizygus marmoreus TaxID=39966 RepID=A0A369JFZ9_HYPMA|nr:hypothetical protein Hypma_012624 [Hypsizygus marmoreus]
MRQAPEAEAFLNRIVSLPKGPGVSLDAALQPSLDDEAELRKLFATDKTNARLNDPLVGLVDVFSAPVDIRTTRARVAQDDRDLSAKYVMPLSEVNRRKEGTPCMINDLEEFKKNWSIFTEGSLSQLIDWNNVVAAGGAVLACLTPLSEAAKESKRSIRKYFHSVAYPTSDVDLFLWGMDAEQAKKKIVAIYEAVRDSIPWDVTCVRTKHTISIHSQYPYRSVQIVLRLYSSPAEIMAGFDIDAPCCLYNGERVLANPRAIVAMMRQANTVDMTRRSPSYEVRLAKYSSRTFEVYVPSLQRDNIDPTIYERSITRIEGLARLLVLEKLTDTDVRYNFLESRRNLRGRPNPLQRYNRRKSKYKGDLKAHTSIGGLEMNDYDVATLHIPYGPGWNARRIDKLVYQTDLGMNSTFNPKNKKRRLHRHPAFFGTMKECLEDCCERCPEPIDADERELQEEEDKQYICGRISFMEEDPGRQSMSGSFNPIDVGEWSGQVYIGETEHFFAAIVANDREGLAKMIEKGADVNRRDHVGRTALHVAILTNAVEIACDLIEAGARMMARLVDGRSALHLAAQFDQPTVIRKLLEKSALNKEVAEAAGKLEKDEDAMEVDASTAERPSSEDDWTSADDGVIVMDTDLDGEADDEDADDEKDKDADEDSGSDDDDRDDDNDNDNSDDHDDHDDHDDDDDDGEGPKKKASEEPVTDGQDFLEEQTNEPDILDVNLRDWDLGFTPLAHAVLSGSLAGIEELLKGGADVQLLSTARDTAFHPLTITILKSDEDAACAMVERLISAGASSSTADNQLRTIFHRAVVAGKVKIVSTILCCDPNAKAVLDSPSFNWQAVIFPVVSAIEMGQYSMLATLLAHGAKLTFTEDDVTRVLDSAPQNTRQNFFSYGIVNAVHHAFLPLESAITRHDDVAHFLLAVGADFNVGLHQSNNEHAQPQSRKSIVDWVRFAIAFLSKEIASLQEQTNPSSPAPTLEDTAATGWIKFMSDYIKADAQALKEQQNEYRIKDPDAQIRKVEDARKYLIDLEHALIASGAKSWNEIYPDRPMVPTNENEAFQAESPQQSPCYALVTAHYYGSNFLPQNLTPLYDELYEACFTGDNEKVQQLCLPQEGSKAIPLNIFVQLIDPRNKYSATGHTPLFAAVMGRRWSTAKLILAIAAAQYHPADKVKKFTTRGITLEDEDSDGESDDSDASDDTVEQEEITFIDVAKKKSTIECEVHPSRLLEASITWRVKNSEGKYVNNNGHLLHKSVYDDDLETFVNLTNIYKSSPITVAIDSSLIDGILNNDRPEMLDEYIRKTGFGIDIKTAQGDQEEMAATNDKNKIYLGLTVHGKKRTDLAKMNDPNATYSPVTHPLVWRASLMRAKRVVEYLAGDRPLTAYRYYATTGGEDQAYRLQRTPDLEKALPQWLGWAITNLGESPLTAAILGGDLDLIKMMFAKMPKLMASSLHERIKFIGYNPLMLAIDQNCTPAVIDYLLAKSISPAENDPIRGWNIYHILCQNNNCELLEHLLKKLPHDVNEALLKQQSKERFNTPLHLAVKVGATRATKLILDFTRSALLMRDIDGSTPLHCAVQRGFGEITEYLVEVGPPEVLYLENGVGEIPIDMATLQETLNISRTFMNENNGNGSTLDAFQAIAEPPRIIIPDLEKELPLLRSTIERLTHEGRLVQKTKLAEELNRFAEMMETKLAAEKAAEQARPVVVAQDKVEENKSPRDWTDTYRTLKAIAEAVAANPRKRQLVHLVDVQKSVQGNLARYATPKEAKPAHDDEDDEGLKAEEDAETKGREESLVLRRVQVYPDGN